MIATSLSLSFQVDPSACPLTAGIETHQRPSPQTPPRQIGDRKMKQKTSDTEKKKILTVLELTFH